MSTHKWDATDLPDLSGRTIVVTGANSGIGLTAARGLAGAGAHVVLAVRDRVRGEQAAETIPGSREVRELDLADLASVRAFAEAWDRDLDVLVNNAGVMAVPQARTRDGFEMQIGTNHLGHFALTNLLLPRITDRVVTVSSTGHRLGTSASTTSTGSTGSTSAGRPTGSRSSRTCCSRSSSSAASPRPARRCARSPRIPAGRPRTSRAGRRTRCRTR